MTDIRHANTPDIGQPAPDFETITHKGEPFKLSEALAAGQYILLVFYRGHW